MNVILGERYKEVPDEVVQYALGFWGEDEAAALDGNVKDKILGRARARELAHWQPAQPPVKEVRSRLGGEAISDDELLLRYFSSEPDVKAMKASPPAKEYHDASRSLVAWIEALMKRESQVYIRTPKMSLRLEKRSARSVRFTRDQSEVENAFPASK
jgi:oxaloacetate decarboxylase alpha subunit